MLNSTEKKGEEARLKIELRAVEKGLIISRPTTLARYDAILDDGIHLLRVQIKYAGGMFLSSGSARVPLKRKNSCSRNAKCRLYENGQIDGILAYIPSAEKIVWLNPDDFIGKTEVSIRLRPSRNNQVKGIIFLENRIW
jgi:hypothetical protein